MRHHKNEDHLARVRAYFDTDAARYEPVRYAATFRDCHQYSYAVRKSIVMDLLPKGGGRLLDVGCGPGIYTADLLACGFTVHGCDISPKMIEKARERFADAIGRGAASFSVGEIHDIGAETSSFDAMLCIGVVSYVSDLDSFLRAANRLVKPNGDLIVQISKKWSPKALDEQIVTPSLRWLKRSISRRPLAPEWDFPMFRHPVDRFNGACARAGFKLEAGVHFDYTLPLLPLVSRAASLSLARFLERKRSTLSQVLLAGDFVGRYRKLA